MLRGETSIDYLEGLRAELSVFVAFNWLQQVRRVNICYI